MSDSQLEELWNNYYDKVFGYFYRRLSNREDVEDLTSITLFAFLDIMKNKGDSISQPDVYLWKIAHNQLLMWIRHKSKRPCLTSYTEEIDFVDESVEQFRSESYKSRISSLLVCIKKHVSQVDYTTIEQSMIEDTASPDIALNLGISSAAVRKRLSRALTHVRQKCSNLWSTYS